MILRAICLVYMSGITKKETRLKLQFVANTDHSIHAGLVAVEALARRFGSGTSCASAAVWIRAGNGGAVTVRRFIVGQLLYAPCSGGGCLCDSEALNDDPLARELFGVNKFAGQSQVGEWLR